jgi:uncharacterized membrane protein YsdA (DUF1294 family)/cold shock CspA family protein
MKGKITSWHDDKGYGFITPLAGGERTFVHVKAFAKRARRPAAGDIVTYTLSTDSRGRTRAEDVTIAGVPSAAKAKSGSLMLSEALAVVFLLLVCAAAAISAVPLAIPAIYLLLSVATVAAYVLDKLAAERGNWRIRERTLHLLALAGGWPGALVAQGRLRHKTRKRPFRTVFRLTVHLNCAALAWLFTPGGANAWQSLVSAIT